MIAPLLLAVALGSAAQAAPADAPKAPAPPADGFRPDPAWKMLGKDLWIDPKTRTLVLRAQVCLREGQLEHLLCLAQTKEHESILSTEAPPRLIHAGLILAVGEPGHPVRYRPAFEAPAGPAVAIEAEWSDGGTTRRLDARRLVREEKTAKPLAIDWVFGGSDLFVDPETKQAIYVADGGDLFTVANFTGAILDLPSRSSSNDQDRTYVANTEAIPPRGTPVTLRLTARKAKAG